MLRWSVNGVSWSPAGASLTESSGRSRETGDNGGHGARSSHRSVLRVVRWATPAGTGNHGEHASGARARAGCRAADARARHRVRDQRPDTGAGAQFAVAHPRHRQPSTVHRRPERRGTEAPPHGPTGSGRGGHAQSRLRGRLLRPDLVRRRHLQCGGRSGAARLAPAAAAQRARRADRSVLAEPRTVRRMRCVPEPEVPAIRDIAALLVLIAQRADPS